MRHLMSFNVHICVKRHHIHNSAFFIYFIFLLRLLQQVLFRIRDILQIKSSLVPISNHPIDLALTLKEKSHNDNTLGKVFLLNSVRRLQKSSNLYRWGALLQEFGVRVKPRSVTCVHKP